MAKVYQVPKLSAKLEERIKAAGLQVERKSKECIKLTPIDKVNIDYKRYYVFHIDFQARIVDGMNMSEHVPGYKRATIWVKPEELQLMLDTREELQKLLANDEIMT